MKPIQFVTRPHHRLYAFGLVSIALLLLFSPSFIGDYKFKVSIFLFVTFTFMLGICQVYLHPVWEMKTKYLIIGCVLLAYPFVAVKCLSHFSAWCCVSEADFGRMCSLVSRTIEVFERNKIPYWVCWGSLLGAVREKDMPFQAVPWEHDFDVCVFEKDWGVVVAALSIADGVIFDEKKKVVYDTNFRTTMARAYVDVYKYTLSDDK
jgi:hypothetical protein